MLVGIHKDPYNVFLGFQEKFEKILDHNGIEHVRLEASQPDFWDIIPKLDLFIYHWGHHDSYKDRAETILPIIENHYGIPTLPNQATCWHYDDKIRQYYLLKKYGYPVVDSWVFWEKKDAHDWLRVAPYPLVFKLKGGSGSSSVVKVNTCKEAEKLVNRMFGPGVMTGRLPLADNLRLKQFSARKEAELILRYLYRKLTARETRVFWRIHKNYAYFQKFYPDNLYDTRVTTVGNKLYAFRRFNRRNDFRASGSDNWSLDRNAIDPRLLQLSLNISREQDFQVMAYDWIYDENDQPRLIEISYCYGDFPEFSDGYWDESLVWHEGNYCTQYFELMTALRLDSLKNLELKPTGHYAHVNAK